jgi:hypothetical protein
MYETHVDATGNSCLIPELRESHLLNIIKGYCEHIKACGILLENKALVEPNNAVTQALKPKRISRKEVEAQAEKKLNFLNDRIQPYVLEAAIRNLGVNIAPFLQVAYGRTQAAEPLSSAIAIITGIELPPDFEDEPSELTEEKLLGKIEAYCKQIKACGALLEKRLEKGQIVESDNKVTKALRRHQVSVEDLRQEAQEKIGIAHKEIQPYVLEACIRNLSVQIAPWLQSAYGRDREIESTDYADLILSETLVPEIKLELPSQ